MLIFSEIGKLEIVLGASPESPAKALEQLFPIDYSENTIRVLLNYSWNEGAGSLLKDLLHLIIKVLKINLSGKSVTMETKLLERNYRGSFYKSR